MSTPIALDWGDITPPAGVRARIEARVRALEPSGPSIALQKTPYGYRAELKGTPAECRLHDADLGSVIDRAVKLIAMIDGV